MTEADISQLAYAIIGATLAIIVSFALKMRAEADDF